MDRPDLFVSGYSTFTDVLVEIAQNTKEISETLKNQRKRPREESSTPEKLVVCVGEDDGDFTYGEKKKSTDILLLTGSEHRRYIYVKPYDAETALFLGGARKADLSESVITSDNEGAGDWTMAMFDRLAEITSKSHCAVFHFI